MASKKPARKGLKSPAPSSPKKAEKKVTIKPKGNVLADLAQAVSGKDGVVEVLRLSSEAVIGHVHQVVSTGSLAVDKAVGIGGLPFGRVVEVYGKEQCLTGDTHVAYHVRALDGRIQNAKGGSLDDLYRRFHRTGGGGKGTYQRKQTEDSFFTAPSVNDEDRIFHNRVVDVVKVGRQRVFRLTTVGGRSVRVTADHEFYVGDGAYKKLSELAVGDTVMVHANTPWRSSTKKPPAKRAMCYVKAHPTARVKLVAGKYRYHVLSRARVAIEADLNGLTVGDYLDRLNDSDLTDLQFLPAESEVHHKDGDATNDSLENLETFAAGEHERHHALLQHNDLRFVCTPDVVECIDRGGIENVYDVKMAAPAHNFVGNGFVVHNCGKTTLAQHVIAHTQKMGGAALLYDAEHKWDRVYAMAVGVDAETLQVVQPKVKSIEAGITFIDRALTHWIEEGHKIPLVIVWDSIAGTPTATELDDLGSQQPGVAARELRRAMRVLGEKVARAGALLLLINQTYEKIGTFGHGPKSSTYGGGGIRYHSTIRIEMIRTGTLKLPNGMPVGIEGIARVFKNSLGVPRDETFAIAYRRGFDDAWTLLEKLKEARFIHAGGGWYTFNEQGHEQIRWQGGFAQLDQMMRESPALRDRLVAIYRALP